MDDALFDALSGKAAVMPVFTSLVGYPASTQIPVQDFSDLNVLNRYNIWMYNGLWFYHITITIL